MAPRSGTSFGPTLALTVAAVGAAFGIVGPLALWVIPGVDLPDPFQDQNQDAETLVFLFTFAVALPLALALVPRVSDRISAGPNAGALAPLAAASLDVLLVLLLIVRVTGAGKDALFSASILWFAVVGGAVTALAADRPRPMADRLESFGVATMVALPGLLVLLVLGLTPLDSIEPLVLLAGLMLACVLVGLVLRGWSPGRLPGAAGITLDALVIVLLFLAVPCLSIFSLGDPAAADETTIMQFHQDFFLGPANQVLGGGTMLVDTLSQYGVGSIYFLAGVFSVIPIGNTALAVVEGLLSAAMFTAGFLTLRLAGATRLLATTTMAVAVIVLVYNLVYPLGGLLQHGAIRFGLPAGVVLGAVFAARYPARAAWGRALMLVTLAVASIWALEAFAYTVVTLTAVIALELWLAEPGARWRLALHRVAAALAACVVAHLALALATLAAAGELPDWGMYLNTLRSFLLGGIGDLTYDFQPWAAAFGVAALYVASTAGIVLLLRGRREVALRQPAAVMALAATTAWGVALFSYFVNRSADHILPYISLPAVMVVCLWMVLASGSDIATGSAVRTSGLGVAVLAVLLVSVAWSSVDERFSQSALAYLIPGGPPLSAALDDVRNQPEIAPGAASGAKLLAAEMPDEHESIVLTSADLGVETLMETERINRIPLADPWEESLVPSEHLPALRTAVDDLDPGDRALLDTPAWRIFKGYLKEPDRDPLTRPLSGTFLAPAGLALLQEWVLKEIGERYRLRPIARGENGIFVAELVPR